MYFVKITYSSHLCSKGNMVSKSLNTAAQYVLVRLENKSILDYGRQNTAVYIRIYSS